MADIRIDNKSQQDEFTCEEIDHTELEIVEVRMEIKVSVLAADFQVFFFSFSQNLQLIGKGSFGSVYRAIWRENTVAVKALSGLPDKGPLVEVRKKDSAVNCY